MTEFKRKFQLDYLYIYIMRFVQSFWYFYFLMQNCIGFYFDCCELEFRPYSMFLHCNLNNENHKDIRDRKNLWRFGSAKIPFAVMLFITNITYWTRIKSFVKKKQIKLCVYFFSLLEKKIYQVFSNNRDNSLKIK